MAVRYETFASIPVNRNARKKLFRAARRGTRPTPETPNIGNAVKCVSVAAAYKDGWEDDTNNPAATVIASWQGAKEAEP